MKRKIKPYKRESLGHVYNHRLEDKVSNKWPFISSFAMILLAAIAEGIIILIKGLNH